MVDVQAPLLEARGVSKAFSGVPALSSVDMAVRRGSVHGVLGKNGAGKSTLMSLIAGSQTPDSGHISFDGEDVTGLTLSERKARGIHLMEQHAEVFSTLSVAENLGLPAYPRRGPVVDWRAVRARATEMLELYGLHVDPDRAAGSLNLPEQRQLCLIKTLSDNGKLAILDEPTTSMSRAEREALFGWIRDLTAKGLTFIYITHSNQDLIETCDEYTVLRDGVVVGSGGTLSGLAPSDLSRLVTGGDVEEFERKSRPANEPLLEVRGLGVGVVEDLSLQLGAGEVLGLVGLPGSGAQTVARALGGLEPPTSGSVSLKGQELRLRHPNDAIAAGVTYLTHDRIHEGVVAEFSVEENLALGNWPRRSQALGVIDRRRMRSAYETAKTSFGIRSASPDIPIKKLSGGNQQKALLGRLVGHDPAVLILDEPTAGVDVGAKEDVHRIIDGLSDAGAGIIMLAYDPSELARLVDRALVFRDGQVVCELSGPELTTDNLLKNLSHGHTEEVKA
jgi:ABC-type sugar transport system ATPase subunit